VFVAVRASETGGRGSRNQADLRMYLAHVARRHVTLELGMEDLETQLEREFKLAPSTLRGELRGLDQLLVRSKDVLGCCGQVRAVGLLPRLVLCS